jgi:hypothetical protein
VLGECKGTVFNSKFLAFAVKNWGAGGKDVLPGEGFFFSIGACLEGLTILPIMLNLFGRNG